MDFVFGVCGSLVVFVVVDIWVMWVKGILL